MTIPKNSKSIFRHRGLVCGSCKVTAMVFGQDPIPVDCPNCGAVASLVLNWDHLVNETVVVTDFVPEPVPSV